MQSSCYGLSGLTSIAMDESTFCFLNQNNIVSKYYFFIKLIEFLTS